MRLALTHTLEPRPRMTARIRAADGASVAWTDDAALLPSGEAVIYVHQGITHILCTHPDPAALIDALTAALTRAEWGVVDVRDIVRALEVSP